MKTSGVNFSIGVVALLAGVQMSSIAVIHRKQIRAVSSPKSGWVSTRPVSTAAASIGIGTNPVTVKDPPKASGLPASDFNVATARSLLSGCTVDAENNPTCAVPPGWRRVTAQGFESGRLPAGQSLCANGHTVIESGFAHTGHYAAVGRYTGGDQQVCWVLSGSQISSPTTYVSWWEYDEAQGKLNQDFFISRRFMYSRQYGIHVDAALQFAPTGPDKCYFNCDREQFYFEPHGGAWSFYGGHNSPGWGRWTQWEVYMSINPSGRKTGEVQVWKNGVSVFRMTNKDIATKFTGWAAANLAVGGVYSKLVWWRDASHALCASNHSRFTTNYRDWTKVDPCPNQAPPNGYVPMFKRYFDDIIVLKK